MVFINSRHERVGICVTNTELFVVRTRCPVCHGADWMVAYERAYQGPELRHYLQSYYYTQPSSAFDCLEGARYSLCACSQCQAVFQKEIPNQRLMSILYDQWIDSSLVAPQNRLVSDVPRRLQACREIAGLMDFLHKPASALRVLDFGMGWGEWAQMAQGLGCTTYGAELSQDRLECARTQGIELVSWEDIVAHQFDLIHTEQVFEHLAEPLEVLRYLKRALTPGGLLKISVPSAPNMQQRLARMDWSAPLNSRYSLDPVAPLEHINFFHRSSLERMAALADMRLVSMPFKLQYQYLPGLLSLREIAKYLWLPIYRTLLKRQNYVLLQHNR